MAIAIIDGQAAKTLNRQEKWALLSPYLRRHGREALSYATLQEGMEYFIAYTSIYHPVFARHIKRIALSDPVCAPEDYPTLVRGFLAQHSHAAFGVISETCAEALRAMGFKVNCIGYEPEIPIQTYNTKGDWKELDLIKRARNEVKREGIVVREEEIESVNKDQ